ncbi:Transmembrane protein 214 [Lonchura striata]|uniref:Transmembrane protein 214 n=1 Tax=Lonchura striata TaxID=40157 RepID=A0A218UBX5_9PASE|nr:Transmembrane protein 214 [Lonchura striata domestica]
MAAARAAPGTAGGGRGRWEVVRKPRRGPAGGAGSRRALGEANAGRAVPLPAPIAASSTIFQLGFERALRRQNKEQVPPAAEPPPRKQHAGKSGRKASGNDAGAQPGRCRSLEEALKAFCPSWLSLSVCHLQLDLVDLQKELQKSQSVFPENPSVWVKDLAGYLNYKLQAPRSDPVLSQHPHDYPYCLVSKELRSIIRSLLAKASNFLELFFDHCIYTMLQELDKAQGESLHGYRICIQALLLYRPRIATTNLSKYLEVLRSQQSRPAQCLTVLWALGQAGFTDLQEGLKVWLGVMLPVLGIKSLSPYAVSYLDRLLMMHPNLTKGFGMIGPKDFFPLLDFAFMPNNSLSPSLQEQLRRLYPRLKVLALGARPEAALHTYFPSFLSRATPACPPAMKEELLTSMSQCLSLDPLSFSVWRQLYTKHLAQSSLLLNHLLECWESSSKKVHQSLQETVRSFKVTNEELAARGAGGDQDVAACDAACKLVATCSAGATGAVVHRGLPCRWLERSLAQHGSVAVSVLGPQLELLWKSSAEVARAVSQQCCSLLSWLQGSLPWLGDWLQTRLPEALLHLAECARELLLFVLRSCLLPLLQGLAAALQRGWQRCLDSCNGDVTWECVRDHLTSFTYSSWIYLQNATLALKNWALAMISGH